MSDSKKKRPRKRPRRQSVKKVRPTNKNLHNVGIRLLMSWLIGVAKKKRRITYSDVQHQLEESCFTSMGNSGAIRVGSVLAGPMQKKIFKFKGHDVPLLNALVVRKEKKLENMIPGKGECIREIFYSHFPEEAWLGNENALEENPEKWKEIANRAIQEVYDYPYSHWENIYEEIFGGKLKP